MNFKDPSDRALPVLTPQVPSASSVSTGSVLTDTLPKPSWLIRLKKLSEKGNFGPVSVLVEPGQKRQPSIDERGVLIIPHESDEKYHWWAGGQSIAKTLEELNAPPEVLALYLSHNNI